MNSSSEFILVENPQYAGCYEIGKLSPTMRFYLVERPGWWNRMFAHWLLGWTWRDGGITQ